MITHSDTFDHDTPLRIGCVRLNVRDRQKVAGFYEDVLGLHRLDDRDNVVTLGTPTVPLLELAGDPALAARNPRDAGLFHTAFLLPSRADLGHWLAAAIARDIPLQGASDHLVSEALYLADPEGNGIEIYADRAPAHWRNARGEIHMTTALMDVPGVLAAGAGTKWTSFPAGGLSLGASFGNCLAFVLL